MGKQQQEKGSKKAVKPRKKNVRNVPFGVAHVKATFNNTIVTFTDLAGNTISWASAGLCKFSGSRKSTAFAGSQAAQIAASKAAKLYGMKECEVNLKGPGAGRESAVKSIQGAGITVTVIRDLTPIPHNGCRPRNRRRV